MRKVDRGQTSEKERNQGRENLESERRKGKGKEGSERKRQDRQTPRKDRAIYD